MPDGSSPLTLTLHERIADLPAEEWDALAGGNPFVGHAFLLALEESGSTGRRTGWFPRHLALRDGAGRLVACAPCYIKTNSYGEYVFDHGWAEAFARAGGRYYPKLQVASPFSPVPGPRLLARDAAARRALAEGLRQVMEAIGASSVHVTFCSAAEWQGLGEAGWLQRIGLQYHWANRGFASFEDFLATLASRKRKQIRRERREAAESGLAIRTLCGEEIPPRLWQAFHRFYLSTVEKRWGSAYLTARFWPLLGRLLGERVVMTAAFDGDEPVAAALHLRGEDALHGRHWGAVRDIPFLHFELCYYRAIDFAIAHGIARVEAGAQGQHKLQRGYLPVETYSAHWIAHEGLRRAVARFLDQERPALRAQMQELMELSPFREG
ncbi:MAG: GNAT family N-acetyltransferase [Rhodovarius sp.]|nr:GNAT family N-acetyltransferase [Rhodovarius sp.]MCX7931047.1 GNAT family N-acetyltransferase [Rhodovarius sp.]MDW8314196.1 GNAT family N-acetyltransferase [Rhodovarius sp.]